MLLLSLAFLFLLVADTFVFVFVLVVDFVFLVADNTTPDGTARDTGRETRQHDIEGDDTRRHMTRDKERERERERGHGGDRFDSTRDDRRQQTTRLEMTRGFRSQGKVAMIFFFALFLLVHFRGIPLQQRIPCPSVHLCAWLTSKSPIIPHFCDGSVAT